MKSITFKVSAGHREGREQTWPQRLRTSTIVLECQIFVRQKELEGVQHLKVSEIIISYHKFISSNECSVNFSSNLILTTIVGADSFILAVLIQTKCPIIEPLFYEKQNIHIKYFAVI